MKERYKKKPCGADWEYLIDKGINRNIAEALSARGIGKNNYSEYFNDNLVFHSPFEMTNMAQAAETISYLIDSGGSVLICGDYDADGLTASSILSLFFTDNGVENNVMIPTRDEGYGLHADKVIKAFERNYYDLIITVDCGISNAEEVQKIIDVLDAEIIVTDHHELPENLPDCLCVNPKLGYPFPYLSGAGVAWKLVEALSDTETAKKYAFLAAIGTIGDIMPLTDENRSLVKLGFANQNHKSLKKLAELSRCGENITCNDIAMRITPKINAAGRMGDPIAALDVLLERDTADSAKINKLLELNEERRIRLDEIVAELDETVDYARVIEERMVFVYSNKWQHGLLGIVAARYKEKYNLPCLVMTLDGDNYVGSARGVDGIDLYEVFCCCKDFLVKFGGHKASVGFTVAKEQLDPFRKAISSALRKYSAECFEKYFYYDLDLTSDLTADEVLKISERLQPLLPQDKFVCRIRDSVKFASAFGKNNAHLSLTLANGLELKGFFKFGFLAPFIKNGADVDLICSLETDSYTKAVCGIIEDLTLLNSVCFDDFYRLNLLKNFLPQSRESINYGDLVEVLKERYTLVVFDDYETFLKYGARFDFEDYSLDIFFDNSVSDKTIVISPLENYGFSKYRNICYFTKRGTVNKNIAKAYYFDVEPANEELYLLDISREVCLAAFSALKRKGKFDSIKGTFDKYVMGKISYAQYLVALRVFQELGIINVINQYDLEINSGVKTELNKSEIFNYFCKG